MSSRRGARWLRLATSLCWTGGVLVLCAAIAGPFVFSSLYLGGFRKDAEAAVAAMVALQNDVLVNRERFLPFGGDGGELSEQLVGRSAELEMFRDKRFQLEGFLGDEGRFVVRAMTRPTAVRNRLLPVMIYQKELDGSGEVRRSIWIDE